MSEGAQPLEQPDGAERRRRFFHIFPAVGLAMFGAAIDQTLVASSLPAIARDLGAVEQVPWIVVLYLVANTVAAPVYGRLGDAFGRQRMLLVALGFYGIGATFCALAPSLPALAAARLVQGFGGGGLISLSVALIGEVVPPRERGRYQAWIAAIFSAASALGPVLGGALTEAFGWRSVFLMQLPLAIATALLAQARLRSAAPGSRRGFVFDWGGLFWFTLFVAPALLALDQVRRLTPDALGIAAGLALIAALALILLIRQERRAADPLLPLALLGEPSVWRANLLTACVAGAFVGAIAFLPIYLVAVRGLSTASAGAALLPLAACAGIGALISGVVLSRTGRNMLAPMVGLLIAGIAFLAIAAGLGGLGLPALVGLLALVSIGLGCSFPMVQVTVQVAVGRERLGTATASVQFCRSLGAATGTALLGAVVFGTLVAQGGEAAPRFVALVEGGRGALADLTPAALALAEAEMRLAFRLAFATAGGLTLLAAWIATRVPLRRI